MRYTITQAELCEAIQLYLNERVLKRPVTITKVERTNTGGYTLDLDDVAAEDDQEQVSVAARAAGITS